MVVDVGSSLCMCVFYINVVHRMRTTMYVFCFTGTV